MQLRISATKARIETKGNGANSNMQKERSEKDVMVDEDQKFADVHQPSLIAHD
jgi:hypothetical protein